jgi:hypothetical protein
MNQFPKLKRSTDSSNERKKERLTGRIERGWENPQKTQEWIL